LPPSAGGSRSAQRSAPTQTTPQPTLRCTSSTN
jgi:hypothetical protein